MNTKLTGALGELAVGRYLREKGYTILSANYRCRLGEIDIIACDKKYICFVEVKTRDENAIFSPCEAVNYSKRKKIVITAEFYLKNNKLKLQPRFDIAEVYIKNKNIESINYIKNAFDGEC